MYVYFLQSKYTIIYTPKAMKWVQVFVGTSQDFKSTSKCINQRQRHSRDRVHRSAPQLPGYISLIKIGNIFFYAIDTAPFRPQLPGYMKSRHAYNSYYSIKPALKRQSCSCKTTQACNSRSTLSCDISFLLYISLEIIEDSKYGACISFSQKNNQYWTTTRYCCLNWIWCDIPGSKRTGTKIIIIGMPRVSIHNHLSLINWFSEFQTF